MSEQEKLKIFDEQGSQIGVATRSEVHRLGHWHEAFHCWFVCHEHGVAYIYLQLRSEHKKDYPNLFDITAAGHLLANEKVEDGVREIKEEIGIDVAIEELIGLGVIKYTVFEEHFIDREFANAFLYICSHPFEDFTLQKEEVSGMVRVKFTDFAQLWTGEKDEVEISGFEVNRDGSKRIIKEVFVHRNQFVPHPDDFYREVVERIGKHL
ncbi:NUDIX hydrolase [Bacillus sp. PS06]|uniref:NUDIX hydrolase n=1 Tax=Bacillus sp. PS06 TaxID=2764176 RepID=UPI00177F2BF8|nr:NUDIX domain-containing protein [Bacillus sp. PS06]MBD8071177.1 NUDIX domain-containing protein [Bacillus sp. PS06]